MVSRTFLRLSRHAPLFRRLIIAALALAGCALAVQHLNAQNYDASNLRQPIDLAATWLVNEGDDPTYARPGFNDSNWLHFDSHTSLHSISPQRRPEVLWLRLHVKVAPGQTNLSVAEHSIASALEIYADGQRIIQSGQVAPFEPNTRDTLLVARIPDSAIKAGSFVLAIRVHPSTLEWSDPYPILGNPTCLRLGEESPLWEHIWLSIIGHEGANWVLVLVKLGLGLTALALFSAQRQHREYLWIFVASSVSALVAVTAIYEEFHSIPVLKAEIFSLPFAVIELISTVLMYLAFLRLPFKGWVRIFTIAVAASSALLLLAYGYGSVPEAIFILGVIPTFLLTAGYIPLLLIVHLRRGNREAGILLIPALLASVNVYLEIFAVLLAQIPVLSFAAKIVFDLLNTHPAGPFVFSLSQFAGFLYVLSLAMIIVLRSTETSRQQALLENEFAAAREVQQVILPERAESVPGFTVESVYEPAQQVGGDFFQILPTGDGGLLVVVGDVAGKGLHAAMLVSVVVGAIRGVAGFTRDPAELLAHLNERLIGRTDGSFSTALAARIEADGSVKIANAGHLSPYLDGSEVELTGALPLGILSGITYETQQLFLAQGSRLTFYSDGVVEAQDPHGELFGFERAKAISTHPAAVIADAAKRFGQEDDITVVTIARNGAVANAA